VDAGGGRTRIVFFESFAELLAEHERTDTSLGGPVILDMPIGLMERGARACDVEARRLIGPRRNSVFAAPIRAVLMARSHAEACALGREAEEKGMSQQAFAILSRIADVDAQMTAARQMWLREGHPEVSFCLLAGAPLSNAKVTPAGREERRALIARIFPDFEAQAAMYRKRRVFVDILDAYALLWSARRVAVGIARVLPRVREVDARGLRVEMVA
jgi:predicted RNase H-like nuclease